MMINKNEWLLKGTDSIDDSIIAEAARYKRSRGSKYIALGAGAAAVLLLAGAGVMAWSTDMNSGSPPTATSEELSGSVSDGDTAVQTTAGGAASTLAGDYYSGIPSDAEITVKGTAPAPESIRTLIEEHRTEIAGLIALDTKDIDGDINISLTGWSTLQTSDNTVAADFMTLPVFILSDSGIRIIGQVDLSVFEGELLFGTSAGGEIRWSSINRAVSENPEDTFAFVYYGINGELMIAQDNTMYELRGPSDQVLDGSPDWYDRYAGEYNTFNFSEMLSSKSYITVERKDIYEFIRQD